MKEYKKLKNYLNKINDLQYLINITNWESKISGSRRTLQKTGNRYEASSKCCTKTLHKTCL